MTKDKIENVYRLTDLKRDVANESQGRFSQGDVDYIARAIFAKIVDKTAVEGVPVYLVDFFNFSPKNYAGRLGHDVRSEDKNAKVQIDPYRVVSAKPTSAVKNKLKEIRHTLK